VEGEVLRVERDCDGGEQAGEKKRLEWTQRALRECARPCDSKARRYATGLGRSCRACGHRY
jgi:hypothetical protein